MGSGGASNTSALTFGGNAPPGTIQNEQVEEEWNGTNWTELNNLNTGGRNRISRYQGIDHYICFSFWWKFKIYGW